jgi:hypothetical protein
MAKVWGKEMARIPSLRLFLDGGEGVAVVAMRLSNTPHSTVQQGHGLDRSGRRAVRVSREGR